MIVAAARGMSLVTFAVCVALIATGWVARGLRDRRLADDARNAANRTER